MNKFNNWFEINLGWLFVNGRKQEQWTKYINTKKLKQNERKRLVLEKKQI